MAAVREGLKDGTLDFIVTDHAPHAAEEKDVEFRKAPCGFCGLETSLGVILTELDDGKFVCHPSDEEPYEEAAYESRAKALADGVFNYDIVLLEV